MEPTVAEIQEHIASLKRVATDFRMGRGGTGSCDITRAMEIESGPLKMWEDRLAVSSASRSS
jgi:hypothetical protein